MRMSWDKYGLTLARSASFRSEDPYLKVGACILRPDRSVAGIGYNGAAPGVEIEWANRDARRSYVIHAEQNAFRFTTPTEVRGGFLYISHHPCLECIKITASYGIKQVMYVDLIDSNTYDLEAINKIAREYNILLRQGALDE